MRLIINMSLDNAAFDLGPETGHAAMDDSTEVRTNITDAIGNALALVYLAPTVEEQRSTITGFDTVRTRSRNIRDENGNTVGTLTVEVDG